MFCKNCGRQLDENENVCPVCGTVNGGETAATPTLEYGYDAVTEANEQLKNGMAGQALTWGILSLAFSASGCLSGRNMWVAHEREERPPQSHGY